MMITLVVCKRELQINDTIMEATDKCTGSCLPRGLMFMTTRRPTGFTFFDKLFSHGKTNNPLFFGSKVSGKTLT